MYQPMILLKKSATSTTLPISSKMTWIRISLNINKKKINMTITKEQFETFNKHFNIIEITHETVQSTAYLDLEEFNEYQDHPDDFLLDTDWMHHSTEITSSDGYRIQYIPSDNIIKEIYDIEDIANFIENDMGNYLAEH